MKFRLSTFLVVLTIVAVIVGYSIQRYQFRQQLSKRYQSYLELRDIADDFSQPIKRMIVERAGLDERYKNGPMPAENYLSGGYGGTSTGGLMVARTFFEYDYEFSWPDEKGRTTDENQFEVSIHCEWDPDSIDPPVVNFRYEDRPINAEIAQWLEQEIAQQHDAKFVHEKRTAPKPADESAQLNSTESDGS